MDGISTAPFLPLQGLRLAFVYPGAKMFTQEPNGIKNFRNVKITLSHVSDASDSNDMKSKRNDPILHILILHTML